MKSPAVVSSRRKPLRGSDVAIDVSKPRFPKLLPTEKAFATERTARVANRIDAGEAEW
jgi:hypothetical protein